MSFAAKIRAAVAAFQKDAPAAVPSGNGLLFWPEWPRTSPLVGTSAAESLAAVIRSVALYCDAVASLPLRAIRWNPDGGAAESVAVPALDLWPFAERELLASDALLTGNGYAVLDPAAGTFQTWPAAYVSPEIDQRTGAQWYRVKPLVASGTERLERAANVVHIRYRPWGDARLGRSPLAIGAPSIAAALEQQAAVRAIWNNLAAPAVTLNSPNRVSQETAAMLKDQWEKGQSGANRGRVAVMGDGLEAKRLDIYKATDAQLIEFARFSVAEISRLFGVPQQLLGETTTLAYATAIELSRMFVISSLRPFLIRIAAELNKVLTDRQRASGVRVEFDTSQLTLSPGKETSDYLAQLVNSGIATPNECRNIIGLPDVPEGGTLRTPAGAAPAPASAPEPRDAPTINVPVNVSLPPQQIIERSAPEIVRAEPPVLPTIDVNVVGAPKRSGASSGRVEFQRDPDTGLLTGATFDTTTEDESAP